MKLAMLVALSACVAQPRRPLDGAIGGLTRDPISGDPIGFTVVHVRGHNQPRLTTTATREGLFGFDHLAPGRYDLDAESGSARADVTNIDVTLGEASVVDVELALGSAAVVRDFSGDELDDTIEHFTPSHHDASTGVIEGTIADISSRRRVAGAVITAIGPGNNTLQTVSDDAGRYRFDAVVPGTYTISAYYGVYGHGQMELRRSEIAVEAARGVRVPLWVETRR
jgi:hypothetical protein